MFNVGGGELLVILLVALIVLGPQRLPGAARQIGRAMSEMRRLSSGFQNEVRTALEDADDESAQSSRRKILAPASGDGAGAGDAASPNGAGTAEDHAMAASIQAVGTQAPATTATKTTRTKAATTKKAAAKSAATTKKAAAKSAATTKKAAAKKAVPRKKAAGKRAATPHKKTATKKSAATTTARPRSR